MCSWKRLLEILEKYESENLEYKEAKNSFSYSELKKYCSGIANCGGGILVLGVNDERVPIGTQAYPDYNNIPSRLFSDIGIVVAIDEYKKDGIRVLVFNVPSHNPGRLVKSDHIPYYRVGSSLVKMSDGIQKKYY
ncbi:MAG: ATP-binding protein [Endomicrobium sp.]|jgi:predicted HTH transcriptional regulator|nr:ATP-binding protein [Endomicrobium sp.]